MPAALRSSRLLLPALTLLTALAVVTGCGDSEPPARPSVLLITIDTLRADHLGPYASLASRDRTTPRTPEVDALAAEGTVFENVAAPMPLTLPSHFSIFTSLYPREHGVMNNAMSLPADTLALPEILLGEGYATGAFVSVSLLDEASGAARGFETFVNARKPRERPAEVAVDAALGWLEDLPANRSFFAWVHLFDPHLPYGPPPRHRRDLDPALAERWPVLDWPQLRDAARENEGEVSPKLFEHALALYRGEVEYVDSEIGRLLRGLEAHDRRDNTLVLLTADHGESFEHGVYFEHADSLFDGAMRVPLIAAHREPLRHWPPAGHRVSVQASSVDIAPTVLRALDLPVPTDFSGRPLQEADEADDRLVLIQHPFLQQERAETHPHVNSVIRSVAGQPVDGLVVESERVGLVGRRWRLVRTDGLAALYRRGAGVDEALDVSDDETETLQRLQGQLDLLLEEHPLKIIETDKINDELRETLEALGYLN